MSDLITAFSSLFTFLISALGDIADFFTSNTIGILILGIAVFGLVFTFIINLINKIH